MSVKALVWENDCLRLLDQSLLPEREEYIHCSSMEEVAAAISKMKIRGAPAIGAAAAFGYYLGVRGLEEVPSADDLRVVKNTLLNTRPTAVNLSWALKRMEGKALSLLEESPSFLGEQLLEEAHTIYREDREGNRRMGSIGAVLINEGDNVLTHCNAGALATAGYGTALGVIRAAIEEGKKLKVYATETRPYLQGARLTTWELKKDGIPVALITDNMVGYLMQEEMIQLVITGADRIAANGDVANKIGTYSLALVAAAHQVPFYVAAPSSTIDLSLKSGREIEIEQRSGEEVRIIGNQAIAPEGIEILHPAFDVTPVELISGIITEDLLLEEEIGSQLQKFYQDQEKGGLLND